MFCWNVKLWIKEHHFGTADNVKASCKKATNDIPEEAYMTPMMLWNLIRCDVMTWEESIFKPINVLH